MRKEIVILFILVSFTFEKVSAQNRENNSYEVIERIAESYADDADDETDLTMLLENLEHCVLQ